MIDLRSRPLLIIRVLEEHPKTSRFGSLWSVDVMLNVKGGDWSVLGSLFTDTVLGVCADALSLVLVHL